MHGQDARPRFDTLFADPRHYRGDCRLLRTAIRQGWLADAPQADREAVVARFEAASRERSEADPTNERARRAEADVIIEMVRQSLDAAISLLRYPWGGDLTGQSTGRPRERWHVTERPNRLDANAIRRQAKAEGLDLARLESVLAVPAGSPDSAGERIALAVTPDARYGWRVWLVCPRCGVRRGHLYPVRSGIRCRECAGLGYAGGA